MLSAMALNLIFSDIGSTETSGANSVSRVDNSVILLTTVV